MIRLFTSFYDEPDRYRKAEIEQCLRQNLNLPAIDSICLFLECSDQFTIEHQKLRIRKIDRRPTYSDFINWIAAVNPAESDLSLIANSDIYFDQSILALGLALKEGQCSVLARWDVKDSGDPQLFNRNDSQDTWVFRGMLKNVEGDFCIGVPRCDNRFLYELIKAGYEVINPAFSIRSYHLHAGQRVEYQNDNLAYFVDPPYAYLWPHNLWPLPRTLIHNIRNPGTKVSWSLNLRLLFNTLPARLVKKIVARLQTASE